MSLFLIFQTLFIYLFLCIVIVVLSRATIQRNHMQYIYWGILVYAIVFGARYGVGGDHLSYLEDYDNFAKTGQLGRDYEIGWKMIVYSCGLLGLPSFFYFFIIAFIQLFLVFLSLRKDKFLFPYLTFVFFFMCIWLNFANGLRQELAFCILTNSIIYIKNSNFWKFLLIVVIASLFHKTAILFVLVYPIFIFLVRERFIGRIPQLAILIVSLLLMRNSYVENILSYLDLFEAFNESDYSSYNSETYEEIMQSSSNIKYGPGFFLQLLIDCIAILKYEQIKKCFSNNCFFYIYVLFYFGLIYKYIFYTSLVFSRINMYFYGFEFIVVAYTLCYFAKQKKHSPLLLQTGAIFLIFLAIMLKMSENSAMFVFNFQDEFFYLKKNI